MSDCQPKWRTAEDPSSTEVRVFCANMADRRRSAKLQTCLHVGTLGRIPARPREHDSPWG